MKQRLSVFGAAVLAMSLSACGGGSSSVSGSSHASAVTSASSTASSSVSSASTSMTTVPAPATRTVTETKQAVASTPSGGATIAAPSEDQAENTYENAGNTKDCSTASQQIKVSSSTTCAFAVKVAQAWTPLSTSQTQGVIYVKSPAIGDTYGLYCWDGMHGNVCATSKGGEVWIAN